MGACLTLERDEIAARRRSDEIDKQLDALAKERPRILKILLLGAGESGLYIAYIIESKHIVNMVNCIFCLFIRQKYTG